MSKGYRFFLHYHKHTGLPSCHYRGKCHLVKKVVTKGLDTETKINPTQPRMVVQGFAENLEIKNGVATFN